MLGTHQHMHRPARRARARRRGQSGKAHVDAIRRGDPAGQQRGQPHELGHGPACRPLIQHVRRGDLQQTTVLEHRHPVGHGQRLFLVVGDQQRGGAETPLQGANLVAQIGAHIGVQGRERLVQQQGAGIDGQRARQRDTLLLAPDSWVTARAACSARPTSSSSSRARR